MRPLETKTKKRSYDGVGMIYARNEDEAMRIQSLDFKKMDGLNPRMEFSVEPF